MTAIPEGYKPATSGPGVYRDVKPNVTDLINALAVLPPDTTFATCSSEWDGGVNEYPDAVWYYADKRQARIG